MCRSLGAYERLSKEYKYLCLISQGEAFDRFKMAELTGKINFAIEYKLITLEEWEILIGKIMKAYNGV